MRISHERLRGLAGLALGIGLIGIADPRAGFAALALAGAIGVILLMPEPSEE